MPGDAVDAHRKFAAISTPLEHGPDWVAKAIADGLPAKTILERVNDELALPILCVAAARAKEIAAHRVIAAYRNNADTLHEALRPTAEDLISQVETAAQCGDVSLEALIRSGRNQEARAQADLALNLSNLAEMYFLRNLLYDIGPGDVQPVDVSQMRDLPTFTSAAPLSDRQTDAARAHSIYTRGGRYWWPTKAQIRARVEELQPAHDAAEAQVQQGMRRDRRASFA